jgi:hypothetical protein
MIAAITGAALACGGSTITAPERGPLPEQEREERKRPPMDGVADSSAVVLPEGHR